MASFQPAQPHSEREPTIDGFSHACIHAAMCMMIPKQQLCMEQLFSMGIRLGILSLFAHLL